MTKTSLSRGASFTPCEALNFFWDTAELLGLADRILLVIGSDFGRTNFINETNGKDHWPIGSYILMEQARHGVIG